jgi:RHS repeat-associated protein
LNGEDSLGLSYEKELKTNVNGTATSVGITEHKHYLQAGGITFAMFTMRHATTGGTLAVPALPTATATVPAIQPSTISYLHHDQLGSIVAITDQQGAVVERLAYDPWGKRRFVNGQPDKLDAITGQYIDRGFTMHEHLDEMGVINMNGRIYDPLIGRFMSADPIIQSPYNLNSFNRYSYVWNNPLKFFDPAGFEVWNIAPDGTRTQTISSGNGDASNSYTGETGIPCTECGAGTRGNGVGGSSVATQSCRGSCYDLDGNLIKQPPVAIKAPIGAPPEKTTATPNPNPPAVAPATSPTPVQLSSDPRLLKQPNVTKQQDYSKVYAVENGVVSDVGWENPNNVDQGFGYRLKVDTIDGKQVWFYAHLGPDSIQVFPGQIVLKNEYLGNYAVPANGSATGPHLHLEKRNKDGTPVLDQGSVNPIPGGRMTSGIQPNRVITTNNGPQSRPHNGTDWAGKR